jgi:ubiquinone/menaquinone biosynthesis C-methylase UbiE
MEHPQAARESSAAVDAEKARLRTADDRRKLNGRYSWFNEGYLFMLQELERDMLMLLEQYGYAALVETRILEVGCGTGHWLREFIKWGARLERVVGAGLLADRVAEARRLCPSGVQLRYGDAIRVEFPDASVDWCSNPRYLPRSSTRTSSVARRRRCGAS